MKLSVEQKVNILQTQLDAAVTDARAWVGVCDALAHVLDAVGTVIIPIDPTRHGPWLTRSNVLDEHVSVYLGEGWGSRDPRLRGVPIVQAKGYVTDHDLLDEQTMARHPYYQEFLRRQGLGTFLGIGIGALPGVKWVAAVQRPITSGSLQNVDIEMAKRLRPMLSQAVRTSEAVASAMLQSGIGYSAAQDRGVALLTRSGRCISLDQTADVLLKNFLAASTGEIILPYAPSNNRLQDLIFRACMGDADSVLPPPVTLSDADGETLLFEVARLPKELKHFHAEAVALLIVRKVQRLADYTIGLLSAKFGLSRSEARVALGVSTGMSPREMAVRFGVAEGTLRQQLKSVFSKTGANSQTRLAAMIAELSR